MRSKLTAPRLDLTGFVMRKTTQDGLVGESWYETKAWFSPTYVLFNLPVWEVETQIPCLYVWRGSIIGGTRPGSKKPELWSGFHLQSTVWADVRHLVSGPTFVKWGSGCGVVLECGACYNNQWDDTCTCFDRNKVLHTWVSNAAFFVSLSHL